MVKPEDLLYSETHEWVRIEDQGGQKVAIVGITAFAIEQLTDLVYLELPEVGRELAVEDECGEVESVKAVSPLCSPVAGVVIAVNSELPDKLEILNQDPYGAGWIMRVRITDDACLGQLMDYAAYQAQCAEEAEE